jgi:glycosyltransferase involved in cell wall biosynthesis
MRVLWLTPELPSPLGAGGALRQWHMIGRLVAHEHEPVVVAPVHPDERAGAERLRGAGVDLRAYERPARRVAETLSLVRRRPTLAAAPLREPLLAWQCDVFWAALGPLAREALASGSFDAVNVNHDWAADWVRRLELGRAARVLTLENLTWSYYENRARSASGPRRALLAGEARRWLRYDRGRFADYDALVTVSEHDAELAARETATRTVAIPSGVDTAALSPAPEPDRPAAEPAVIFTGNMRWPPNAEAVRWLMREVWPRVAERVPAARLVVVGADPPADVLAHAGERVEVPGRVPELEPWFERASIVAIPILSGAGIRLKVLDALASGRAIVSTTMGAEGARVVDGEHVLIRDDERSFADAVVRLLEDRAERRRLGANARRLAEERYDWRALGDRFEALLRELTR